MKIKKNIESIDPSGFISRVYEISENHIFGTMNSVAYKDICGMVSKLMIAVSFKEGFNDQATILKDYRDRAFHKKPTHQSLLNQLSTGIVDIDDPIVEEFLNFICEMEGAPLNAIHFIKEEMIANEIEAGETSSFRM